MKFFNFFIFSIALFFNENLYSVKCNVYSLENGDCCIIPTDSKSISEVTVIMSLSGALSAQKVSCDDEYLKNMKINYNISSSQQIMNNASNSNKQNYKKREIVNCFQKNYYECYFTKEKNNVVL